MPDLPNPESRVEQYLANLTDGTTEIPKEPESRIEQYLDYLAKNGGAGVNYGTAPAAAAGMALVAKTIVDGKVTEWEFGDAGGLKIHICTSSEYGQVSREPVISSPDEKTLYLVPAENGSSPDLFVEWAYVNNNWEMFGSASIGSIPDSVNEWLTEHITNPDSPPLDRSLSSSSAAAPADLVGEELTSIKQDLSQFDKFYYEYTDTSLFEKGAIDAKDGTNYASGARARTISYLPADVTSVRAESDYLFLVLKYTTEDAYVGAWNGSGFTPAAGTAVYVDKFLISDSDKYKLVVKREDGATITINETANVIMMSPHIKLDTSLTKDEAAQGKAVGDAVSGTNNLIKNIGISLENKCRYINAFTLDDIETFSAGKALNSTGAVIAQAASYCSEDYIAIPFENMQITSEVALTNWAVDFYHWICFYDERKAFVSRAGGNKKKLVEITEIPTSAKYCRITLSYVNASNVSSFSFALGTPNNTVLGSPKKKWYVLGDSISAGYYSMTEAEASEKGITLDYHPDNIQGVGSKWDSTLNHNYWGYANKWYLHHELHGMATPGQGYFRRANPGNGVNVVNDNTFEDASLITVAWGFNDWHYNQKRGDHTLIDDNVPYPTEGYDITQITTINQAIWYCLGELIRKAPNAKIVVQTPMNGWAYGGDFASNWSIGTALSQSGTLADIHDDIKYWADYYGLQVLDMTYNNSCVNRRNIQTALVDGSHPSDITHMQLARSVWAKLGF